MKKVTRKELILLAVILVGFSLFVIPRIVSLPFVGARFPRPQGGETPPLRSDKKGERVYFCPMHPGYVSDRPGDCPICFMKLVPKPEGEEKKERKILYYRHPMGQPDISPVPKKDSMGMDYIPVYEDEALGRPSEVPGHTTVRIPLEKQQLMGVKLGTVEKRKLVKEIRTVGRVAYDPELFTAQQEFLSAVESLNRAEGGPYHEPLARAQALVESTKVRLRLLGMSEEEIAELEKQRVQDRDLILPGDVGARFPRPADQALQGGETPPLQSFAQFVWVYGMIYEYEIPFVKVGTPVKVRVATFADKEFLGEVRSLNPVLEAATRSIRARARVANPEGLLRPEMYVDVYFEADLGEALAVPEEAVMHTGEQTIVFVAQGEGFFEPRGVTLGTKAGNFYEVKSGLEAGERVAVSGNFLIDSESRLQAALAGMTGGEHSHA